MLLSLDILSLTYLPIEDHLGSFPFEAIGGGGGTALSIYT